MKKITTFLLSTIFPSKTLTSKALHRVVRIALFLIFFSSFCSYAAAGIQEKQDISKMVQRAKLIVRGKVISTESQWKEDSRGRHIYTSVTVRILDKIKGDIKDDAFAFEVVGGIVGDIGETVSDTPTFAVDEEAIVFLGGQPLKIRGGINGKVPIYGGKIYRDDSGITADSFIQAIRILEQDPNALVSFGEKYQALTGAAAQCYLYSGVKWCGTSPSVTYKINENTSDCTGEGAAVQAAATSWNNTEAYFTFVYGGSHTRTSTSQNSVNEIMWGTSEDPDAFAITAIWYNTSTKCILECDIVFNDPDYVWSTKTEPSSWEADVETVALHEFGHWLSLDDLYNYDDRYNVMYGYGDTGEVKRALQLCDIDGICYIYGCEETCLPPTGVTASDGSYTDKVQITWNSVSSPCNYYRVYRATSSGGTKTALGSGCQTSTAYNDSTATPGTTYYYWVKSAKDSSCSAPSDFSSYDTGWRKLSPPTGVSASDGTYTDKVRVAWNSVTGASYYRVYRATSSGGTKTALGSWQSSTTYDDHPPVAGQTYYYWVTAAVDSSGSRQSDYSPYDTGWQMVTHTLTVASSNPNSGVPIMISPSDNNGQSNGITQFTRAYNNNTAVVLTAPLAVDGNSFKEWLRNDAYWTNTLTADVTMNANCILTAVYEQILLGPMTVDLNNDGIPNFYDFSYFAIFWQNTSCLPPSWCEGRDFDHNGVVDINDLQIFAEFWLWPVADIDINGDVDFVDYAVFASHWMEQDCVEPNWCSGTDFNKSGSVNVYDLGRFAEYWLEGL